MKIDIYSIMIMAISIMFVLITFYLWLKYGKEDNDMEVIEEFYPPKECNSLETGYIYKRYIDKKDVVSLLIYLANKGYLKIEQTTDQGIFKKSKGFRIIKIKEYEGNNEIEKIFLEELFFHSDNSVTGLQLKDNFEKATEKVKKIISDNNWYIKDYEMVITVNGRQTQKAGGSSEYEVESPVQVSIDLDEFREKGIKFNNAYFNIH